MREPTASAAGPADDDGLLVSARFSAVSRRAWMLYGTLIVAIGVVGWFAYSSIYHTSSSAASGIARTVTASRGNVQSSVSASGNVSPAQTSSPTFGTSGTLTALTVKVGSRVRRGQIIARIDAIQANATLASDKASLQSAESALVTARAGGNATQRAQSASSLASAKLQLASARQTLANNEATLATARKQLLADQRLGCVASSSSASASDSSSSSSTATPATGTGSTSGASNGNTRTTQAVSAATAPTATTGSPSTTTAKAVTLTGTVNPNGAATTYVFEYGTKAAFGSTTRSLSAGSGTAAVTAEATIGGLKAGTTYVYRLVAKNAEGSAKGLTRTFTTATTSCAADREAITAAERTVTQQKLTAAQQQQSVASAQAGVSSAVDSATVAQDEAQVTQARLTVATAAKAVRATVLRAPIAGTVTAVNASVGDTVGSSSSSASSSASSTPAASTTSSAASSSGGVVTIANLKKLEVVAGFAEADATKIKVGQNATVTLSALPNTSVAGKVTAVSPTSTVTSNVVTYDITVRLVSPPASVLDGMTADVSVTVERKTNVLQLPSAAITATGPSSTVSVLRDGKQTTTTVTTGLVGASTTEILTGIKEGDVIVEPTVSVSASSSSSSIPNFGGGAFPGGGPGGP
jgi:multidrug efflux pump subunit AcrA (membrane-fusion protein)